MDASALPVDELAEEAAFLWMQRDGAVSAPHFSRAQFAALDERLAAQLDALATAGESAREACARWLGPDEPAPDVAFVVAVLQAPGDASGLANLVERCRGSEAAMRGLASALGWLGGSIARDVVARLVASGLDPDRRLALRACRLHRADPGALLERGLQHDAPATRAEAARTVGELGLMKFLPALHDLLADRDAEARFHAARSLCLLGDAGAASFALQAFAMRPGSRGRRALLLLLKTLDLETAHRTLQAVKDLPDAERLRIIGTGHVGDPRYVPWLIERMGDIATARIAGEAFVHITGADVNLDQLEAMPPEGHDDGPSDDPDDADVASPEDVPLPWLDVERVERWWRAHGPRRAVGTRLFLGEPVTPEHLGRVLRAGLQRQRVMAALYLASIRPGSALFPTAAPAWRQQRSLDARPAD